MSLVDLMWSRRELVSEVATHNVGVIIRRKRGGDWDAPENQYRNAITEALTTTPCENETKTHTTR